MDDVLNLLSDPNIKFYSYSLLVELMNHHNLHDHLVEIALSEKIEDQIRIQAAYQLSSFISTVSPMTDSLRTNLSDKIIDGLIGVPREIRNSFVEGLKFLIKDTNKEDINKLIEKTISLMESYDRKNWLVGYILLDCLICCPVFANKTCKIQVHLAKVIRKHILILSLDASDLSANIQEYLINAAHDARFEDNMKPPNSEILFQLWIDLLCDIIKANLLNNERPMDENKYKVLHSARCVLTIFVNENREEEHNFWLQNHFREKFFMKVFSICEIFNQRDHLQNTRYNKYILYPLIFILLNSTTDASMRNIFRCQFPIFLKDIIYPHCIAQKDCGLQTDILTECFYVNKTIYINFLLNVLHSTESTEHEKSTSIWMIGEVIDLLLALDFGFDVDSFLYKFIIPIDEPASDERQNAKLWFIENLFMSSYNNKNMIIILRNKVRLCMEPRNFNYINNLLEMKFPMLPD